MSSWSAFTLANFAALCVSITVILVGKHDVYGEFSGLSSAAFSALLLTQIQQQPRRVLPYIISLLLLLYLYLSTGHISKVHVAHEAHFAGVVAGIIYTLILNKLAPLNNSYPKQVSCNKELNSSSSE